MVQECKRPGHYPKQNAVHNRALQAYLCVYIYCLITAVQGEREFVPPNIRRTLEMARLWSSHITQLDEVRLPRKIFGIAGAFVS